MALYSWFTIKTTSWRTKFRKQANAADNRAATMSVDSLINYEAVKVSSFSIFLPVLLSTNLVYSQPLLVLQQREI